VLERSEGLGGLLPFGADVLRRFSPRFSACFVENKEVNVQNIPHRGIENFSLFFFFRREGLGLATAALSLGRSGRCEPGSAVAVVERSPGFVMEEGLNL
jgi:hypothetical protein